MKIQRRTLLTAGSALAASSVPLWLLLNRSAPNAGAYPQHLVRDPRGILDLPAGFSYVVIERAGEQLSDGYRVPGLPDGMACFAGPGQSWVLLRNHELDRARNRSAFPGKIPVEAYDRDAFGGVTRVVVERASLKRLSSNLVLAGTLRNCSGGPSPWGWLSCEESVVEGHGYVFRCPVDAERLRPAEKIAAYGRFNHESVCVDPATSMAYLTEDREDSCLYRFAPRNPSRPFEGRLQALRVRGRPKFDIPTELIPGQRVAVDWCDLHEPDPRDDSLRYEGRELGAASLRRGEGTWFHESSVYIASTNGGRFGKGQILRLQLGHGGNDDELEVAAESLNESMLDGPDNITVAPWGAVYIAEDGGGEQCIRVLGPSGRLSTLARNALSSGEFAGVCFAPDGSALFVNLQSDGLTLGIRGPFEELEA